MWGTSDFLGGTASRKISPIGVVAVSEVFGLLGPIGVLLVVGGFGAPTGYVGWGLLGAVSGTAAIVAFYQALATGTMGVVAPIAASGVVVPFAVGLVQGDRLGAAQAIGVAVAIAGIVLASGPELRAPGKSRAASARPLLLAVVAAIGFGLVLIALDHGARSSTLMTLVVMRSASVVLLIGVAAVTGWGQLRVGTRNLPLLVLIGGLDVGANAAFGYATHHGLLALVSVLSSLYPAVTVILARGIHGERLQRVQLAGVLGALAGVALIASAGAG
jgi:drug/metabolite transporter (DMT)-like permease